MLQFKMKLQKCIRMGITILNLFSFGEVYRRIYGHKYRDHMFFHALTFAGSRGCCLNTRPIGRVIKHLLRDSARVMIVILAYFTLFQPKLKTLLKH